MKTIPQLSECARKQGAEFARSLVARKVRFTDVGNPFRRLIVDRAEYALGGKRSGSTSATAKQLGITPAVVSYAQKQATHLEAEELGWSARNFVDAMLQDGMRYFEMQDAMVRVTAETIVADNHGNRLAASRALQIHRNTIWKMEKR